MYQIEREAGPGSLGLCGHRAKHGNRKNHHQSSNCLKAQGSETRLTSGAGKIETESSFISDSKF